MGNYHPGAKSKASRKKLLNAENIQKQVVYQVSCKNCAASLSQRTCRIHLASELDVSGYSTDIAPQAVQESKQFQSCKECFCFIRKGYCKSCKHFVAIHSIYLCKYCQKQPTNGHKWIFLDVQGKPLGKKWQQLEQKPPAKTNFYQLLTFLGVSQEGLNVLRSQKIVEAGQLYEISNQLLKAAGISLGDIGILRKLK